MEVIKALNNNMVLCKDEEGKETICQGKGIGFHKRAGDVIDENLIERRFVPSSKTESRHFQQLFSEIPEEFWELAERVTEYARTEYHLEVSDKVILPICDHMAGSVERYEKGVELYNPMLWDIKRVYPDEFAVGMYALKLLEERFHVKMKEDEAAFLAYHYVNAELGSNKHVTPDEVAKFINSVVNIVQESFQIQLDDSDWNYQRFLTHLKFFAKRVLTRGGYDDQDENELYQELSSRYKNINNCVKIVADYILIEYHYDISMDERLYLLAHIQRVTKRYLKK